MHAVAGINGVAVCGGRGSGVASRLWWWFSNSELSVMPECGETAIVEFLSGVNWFLVDVEMACCVKCCWQLSLFLLLLDIAFAEYKCSHFLLLLLHEHFVYGIAIGEHWVDFVLWGTPCSAFSLYLFLQIPRNMAVFTSSYLLVAKYLEECILYWPLSKLYMCYAPGHDFGAASVSSLWQDSLATQTARLFTAQLFICWVQTTE